MPGDSGATPDSAKGVGNDIPGSTIKPAVFLDPSGRRWRATRIVGISVPVGIAAGGARYVIQRFGYAETAKKTISLTFDDGPDPKVTPHLLDMLSANNVPVNSFVLGKAAATHPANSMDTSNITVGLPPHFSPDEVSPLAHSGTSS